MVIGRLLLRVQVRIRETATPAPELVAFGVADLARLTRRRPLSAAPAPGRLGGVARLSYRVLKRRRCVLRHPLERPGTHVCGSVGEDDGRHGLDATHLVRRESSGVHESHVVADAGLPELADEVVTGLALR